MRAAGKPEVVAAAAGADLAAYTLRATQHVVYVGIDRHVHELFRGSGKQDPWDHDDLTLIAGGATADPAGPVAAYAIADDLSQHAVYLSADGRLHALDWAPNSGTHDRALR